MEMENAEDDEREMPHLEEMMDQEGEEGVVEGEEYAEELQEEGGENEGEQEPGEIDEEGEGEGAEISELSLEQGEEGAHEINNSNEDLEHVEEEEGEPEQEHLEEEEGASDPHNPEHSAEEYPEDEEQEGEHAADGPVARAENNNNQDASASAEDDGAAKRKRTASHSSADEGPKRKQVRSSTTSVGGQKHDAFCWSCHKDGVQILCKSCPRTYHAKCMHVPADSGASDTSTSTSDKKDKAAQPTETAPARTSICPECMVVMNAENLETRSESMKHLTIDQLITMLVGACERMKTVPGADPFQYPVDPAEALDYFDYIVYPMDLSTLEANVKKRQYGSTEAFLADAQWLVHNSVVFNSDKSPFTAVAKKILKVCKQEIQDIETCAECYVNAHSKPDVWFTEACKRPHVLVWAKLKGFPYWPAKAMRIRDDVVDVRFFGAHDRAWVVRKDCFLYSEEAPGTSKRSAALLSAIDELNSHIEHLKEKHGPFVPAPVKTPIGPQLSTEQIRQMLPEYKPEDHFGAGSAQVKLSATAAATASSAVAVAPAKKSPMTIRISSLKTNPTIVTNSVADENNSKPILRVRKMPSVDKQEAPAVGTTPQHEKEKEAEMDETMETEEGEGQLTIEEETEVESKPTPTGILASALARPTRRNSHANALAKGASPSPRGDDHSEKDESSPPLPKSFLNSLGLMKTSEVVKKKPSQTQLGKLLHPSEVFVKDEGQDEDEYSDGGMGMAQGQIPPRKSGGQQQGGMRFNLSKDISISPVADDSGDDQGHHPQQHQQHLQQQPRRLIQGHNARLVPGLIPQNAMGVRPRQMMNANNGGGGMRLAGGQGQQNRMMIRAQGQQRPGGMQMRPGMRMNGPRPQNMMQMKGPNQGQGTQSKLKEGLMMDHGGSYSSTAVVQSLQGITLPGGTITVTPLAPTVIGLTSDGSAQMSGGQVVVKQNISSTTANGLPISVLAASHGHDGQSLLKSSVGVGNKPNPQRKNLMNQVPPAVGHLVQNLQKTLVENVKTTMEQIVVEMLEKTGGGNGGPEMKTVKEENEKLKKQLMEYKHNHESVVRDLKEAMMTDKKRALMDQKRQLEQDKNKAVDETKKKQWCARCGREAQFYCCWNTSYCGYPCQEDHWPSHMNACSQGQGQGNQRQ